MSSTFFVHGIDSRFSCFPCYIMTISLHLILGTLKRKLYDNKIFYQAVKTQSTWKLGFRAYPEDQGAKRQASR